MTPLAGVQDRTRNPGTSKEEGFWQILSFLLETEGQVHGGQFKQEVWWAQEGVCGPGLRAQEVREPT